MASSRLRSSTESMSGASSSARPCGTAVGGDQLERAGVAGGARRALEPGQDPVRVEPRGVGGVVHEDGRPGRRPQHARVADPRADRELTSVDLPAPVEPPTTASSGASICASRGST